MEAAPYVDPILRPVVPHGIAVGRRHQFECLVDAAFNTANDTTVAALIFDRCELRNWGWEFGAMRIHRVGVIPGGTIWQVERA